VKTRQSHSIFSSGNFMHCKKFTLYWNLLQFHGKRKPTHMKLNLVTLERRRKIVVEKIPQSIKISSVMTSRVLFWVKKTKKFSFRSNAFLSLSRLRAVVCLVLFSFPIKCNTNTLDIRRLSFSHTKWLGRQIEWEMKAKRHSIDDRDID
jgi:hypothetical protein